jgi:hypothetical protein
MTDMDELGPAAPATRNDTERVEARKRIEKRRNLLSGAVAFMVVNAALVAIWAVTGGGYFWPGWVMAIWGAGMIMGFWDYTRRPISEADVDAELRRHAPTDARDGRGSRGGPIDGE